MNVVDDVTRECLAAIPDTSISGHRVARELAALIGQRGKARPDRLRQWHPFTSNAMLAWAGSASSIGTSLRRANRCRTASAKASCIDLYGPRPIATTGLIRIDGHNC
ncbi:hypothetical protein [Bradyrhizobium yuanmingense]|uniref:hypothetical protein n=1 Tax=Bradyrhizobium yuanmingense TaxID=108015 RepID=UPI003B9785D6